MREECLGCFRWKVPEKSLFNESKPFFFWELPRIKQRANQLDFNLEILIKEPARTVLSKRGKCLRST